MKIKDLFNKNKQQQQYVAIKYSKLDHIGKVQKIPIIQKNTIDGIKNDVANNTNNINDINNNITNINNRINTNINNIANNVSNINNINNKVNKITNDLANANLANYKGIYNNQTNYKLGDLVSDTTTNNVYLSVSDNNVNNALTNNNFWKIITFTIDASNFITSEKLDNRLSNYWTSAQTVEQINLKQHKQSYYKQFKQNMNCHTTVIRQDSLNQIELNWYQISGSIDVPTFKNVEPLKDYYVVVYCRLVKGNRGGARNNSVVFSKLYTSTREGNLVITINDHYFTFGVPFLLTEPGRNKNVEITFDVVAIRIGN